jgi:CheY-like chemotaxis protein
MAKFSQYLDMLSDACKETIEQMTRLKIDRVEVIEAIEPTGKVSFAHTIAYTDYDEKVDGNFILAFESIDAALNLASSISERLGIGRFEAVCEDSTDLLNEFLNVVVGRTISEWDSIGLSVKFDTPVFKENYESKDSKNTQGYLLSMDVAPTQVDLGGNSCLSKIVLRVDFSDTFQNRIKGKKILLVDDSRVMRRIIGKVLTDEGGNVQEAGDGEEAIEIHKVFNPDLTLMDINMPKMGGFESILHIQEFNPDAKFIILSSSSRKDEIIMAKKLKVVGYLVKPCEPDQLIERVSDML